MRNKWQYIVIGILVLALLPLLLNPLGLALAATGLLMYPFMRAAMRAGEEDAERMRSGLPARHASLGHDPFRKDGK